MNKTVVLGFLVLTVLASGCIASPGPAEPDLPENESTGADDAESPESPETGQESNGQTGSPPSSESSNPFSGVTP